MASWSIRADARHKKTATGGRDNAKGRKGKLWRTWNEKARLPVSHTASIFQIAEYRARRQKEVEAVRK